MSQPRLRQVDSVLGQRWLVERRDILVMLDEVDTSDARREALCQNMEQVLPRLHAPGLVTIRDPEWEGKTYRQFLEMPRTARPLVRGPYGKEEVFKLGYALFEVIRQAQKCGICHLTLSPRTVYRSSAGMTVTDFWWATDSDGSPHADALTPFLGLEHYPEHARPFAAPEALAGQPQRLSDYYALARLMVTWSGAAGTERSELEAVGLSGAEAGLLRAMLDPDPARRPPIPRIRGLLALHSGVSFQ